jgi:hypothetical protein
MDTVINWFSAQQAGGTFLIIGIIFLVLLVIAIIFDGLLDFFDFGGAVPLEIVSAFGTIFGFVGYASMGAGATVGTAAIIGSISGLIGAVGAWFLSRWLKKGNDQGDEISVETVVGKVAYITTPIPENGYGEIKISLQGLPHSFAALADNPIGLGKKVKILAVLSETSVKVELQEDTEG